MDFPNSVTLFTKLCNPVITAVPIRPPAKPPICPPNLPPSKPPPKPPAAANGPCPNNSGNAPLINAPDKTPDHPPPPAPGGKAGPIDPPIFPKFLPPANLPEAIN